MPRSRASSSEFEVLCMNTVCLYGDVHVREMYSLCELVSTLVCFPDSSGRDGEEGMGARDGGDRVGGRVEGGEDICVGKSQLYSVHAYILQQKAPNQGNPVENP